MTAYHQNKYFSVWRGCWLLKKDFIYLNYFQMTSHKMTTLFLLLSVTCNTYQFIQWAQYNDS